MSLPEKENKKINEKAGKKVEGSPDVPHAASGSSQPTNRRQSSNNVGSSQPTNRRQSSNNVGFRIDRALEAADECLQDEGINVDAYIDLFKEFMRGIEAMGSVFSFIGLEVYEKLEILRNFCISEGKVRYRTVERILQHHRDNPELNDEDNPARTLLRLHRTLQLVSKGIVALVKAEKEDGIGQQLRELYMATVAPYHNEQTQHIVSAVLVITPPSGNLIKRLVGTDSATQDHLLAATPTLCNRIDHLFEATEKLYAKYDMLHLP